ncbi:MAG: hypothetical protein KGL26_00750, partial [Pseudomonadota bacterium]|nr:hypothetical protein [Pseudomonadota bacterium]
MVQPLAANLAQQLTTASDKPADAGAQASSTGDNSTKTKSTKDQRTAATTGTEAAAPAVAAPVAMPVIAPVAVPAPIVLAANTTPSASAPDNGAAQAVAGTPNAQPDAQTSAAPTNTAQNGKGLTATPGQTAAVQLASATPLATQPANTAPSDRQAAPAAALAAVPAQPAQPVQTQPVKPAQTQAVQSAPAAAPAATPASASGGQNSGTQDQGSDNRNSQSQTAQRQAVQGPGTPSKPAAAHAVVQAAGPLAPSAATQNSAAPLAQSTLLPVS